MLNLNQVRYFIAFVDYTKMIYYFLVRKHKEDVIHNVKLTQSAEIGSKYYLEKNGFKRKREERK